MYLRPINRSDGSGLEQRPSSFRCKRTQWSINNDEGSHLLVSRWLDRQTEWLTVPVANAGTGIYYVHNDHLGTPQILTDENQQVVWQAEYTPFGQANITTATIENNIGFPGQYWDEETGFHYNHFRYYDPQTGRYITSDPRGILLDFSDRQRQIAAQMGIAIPALDHVDGLNHTYGYVDQNPLIYTDSTGEFLGPLIRGIDAVFQLCVRFKLSCAAVGGGIAGKNIADRLEEQAICEIACTNHCPVGAADSLFNGSNNFTAFSDTNDPGALTGCKAQCVRDVWGGKPRRSPLPNRL